MEIDIKEKIKNPLLARTEIHFDCLYQGESTPRVLDVKNKLIAILDADKKHLVVDKILPTFGEGRAKGYAKLYDSEDNLVEIERKHVLEKNMEKTEAAEEKAQEKEK